jgi:hypothetical protein
VQTFENDSDPEAKSAKERGQSGSSNDLAEVMAGRNL